MKVVSVAASKDGFRSARFNSTRVESLMGLLEDSTMSGDLFLLPAGFFYGEWSDVHGLLKGVIGALSKRQSWLLVGFDAGRVKVGRTRKNELPFFTVALGPKGQVLGPWRQVSTTNMDAEHGAHDAHAIPSRAFQLGRSRVLPLVCGEMHSPFVRSRLMSARPDVVVVAGHASLGQGLVPALKAVAHDAACGAIHAQHLVTGSNAYHHSVTKFGHSEKKPLARRYGRSGYWLSAQSFQFD